MWHNFPDDVVAEILCRLPLNSIVIWGCVCKSWYSLIRSSNFMSIHFHKTLPSKKPQLFLYVDRIRSKPYYHKNLISFLFNNMVSRDLHLTDPFFSFNVIGSVNGVICLVDLQYGFKFMLYNPSIRRSISLPIPQFVPRFGSRVQLVGFGFDDTNQDHKIVRISKNGVAEIYSLNSDYWRNTSNIASIPKFFILNDRNSAAFVNGGLHWVVRDANENVNVVMVFDLKSETFRRISLPKCLANLEIKTLVVKDFQESSIVVLQLAPGLGEDKPLHTWLMEDYGSVKSWKKLASYEAVNRFFIGKCEHLNKEFVMKMVDMYRDKRNPGSLNKYVPSLFLLDKPNNVDHDGWLTCTKRIKRAIYEHN